MPEVLTGEEREKPRGKCTVRESNGEAKRVEFGTKQEILRKCLDNDIEYSQPSNNTWKWKSIILTFEGWMHAKGGVIFCVTRGFLPYFSPISSHVLWIFAGSLLKMSSLRWFDCGFCSGCARLVCYSVTWVIYCISTVKGGNWWCGYVNYVVFF